MSSSVCILYRLRFVAFHSLKSSLRNRENFVVLMGNNFQMILVIHFLGDFPLVSLSCTRQAIPLFGNNYSEFHQLVKRFMSSSFR